MSTGSQSLSNETEESIRIKIIKGQTSKTEVRAMFGSPNSAGKNTFSYHLYSSSAGVVNYIPIVNLLGTVRNASHKTLTITFYPEQNGRCVVKDFITNESDNSTRTGLFK